MIQISSGREILSFFEALVFQCFEQVGYVYFLISDIHGGNVF